MQADEFFLGLKLSEFVMLIGIVVGPIVAVCISLVFERFRRQRDERTQVLRALLATRTTPADPNYNGAINLVPVYFNAHKKVMTAWHDYIDTVRYKPTPGDEAAHNQRVNARQTALIFSIMQSLKLTLSETEIQSEAYISTGFVTRDTLYVHSLEAMPQIAAAVQKSAEAAEKMANIIEANAQRPRSG